jgi:hypothetical protein
MYMKFSLFWEITQRRAVIPYRRFGTTLKMEPISCPEMSVRNYHSMLRNILEKRRSQIQNNSAGRRKNIKWAIITTVPTQARSNVIILVPPCKEQQRESCVQFTTQLRIDAHVQSLWLSAYIQNLITKWTQIYKFYYISSRTSLTTISYCYSDFTDHNVCNFALFVC